MFWQTFQRIEPALLKLYRRISEPPSPNLKSDRDIEYSWIAAHMPEGPGDALDFGTGRSWLGLLAARKGFNVAGYDVEQIKWFYEHPRLKFIRGDILESSFPLKHFDLVISCSAVEHVGLGRRYGVTECGADGDIEAMHILKAISKPNGIMLLTIPVGRDRVFAPRHRVYGERRLPRLLKGWEILKKEYWIKGAGNTWIMVGGSVALDKEPLPHCYGLGLFVLRKPQKGDLVK